MSGEDGAARGSFSQGVGQWIGAAEVYDGNGQFAGHGRDERTVVADDGAGVVTVDVSFKGPFELGGRYTIADKGDHRRYEGPLNYGYAEVLGDGLIAAHNYWPDLGLSQRFFLMVLPDGSRQMSLALINRGERAQWAVVGEYQRQTDPDQPTPPVHVPIDTADVAGDPTAGRGDIMLHRPGTWSGRLTILDQNLEPATTVQYTETVSASDGNVVRAVTGAAFVNDGETVLHTDGLSEWSPPGDVVGSASLFGGRAMSCQFLHQEGGVRVWTRRVLSLDGTTQGVLDTWYRGEQRIGVSYGSLTFESH